MDEVDPLVELFNSFDPDHPEDLITRFRSPDRHVRRRALFDFGWLGRKAHLALDAALDAAVGMDWWARYGLMEGLADNTQRLSPRQAARVLAMSLDPHDLVRSKVVLLPGFTPRETLEEAVHLVTPRLRGACVRALSMLDSDPADAQAIFDWAIARRSVASTFALGALERMAREGRLVEPPQLASDDGIGPLVLGNIVRLHNMALRRAGRPPIKRQQHRFSVVERLTTRR